MKKCELSKQTFLEAIKAIQRQMRTDAKITKHLQAICPDSFVTFGSEDAVSGLINLLDSLTNDFSWVSYWFYDLDQGRKERIGSVKVDGKPVRLRTPEQLWRFLVEKN